MNTDGEEINVKCVLLGATAVGKSSLLHYIIYDEPSDGTSPTIAAQHSKLTLQIPVKDQTTGEQKGQQTFKLSLWDTGGQERFSATSPIYIRGSQVAIIVASTDDDHSVNELSRFLKLLNDHAPDAHYIFALNKCDLIPEREIGHRIEEVREKLMETLPPESMSQLSVIPCSAFTGVGVHEAFGPYQEHIDKKFHEDQMKSPTASNDGQPKEPPIVAIVPQLVQYLVKLASDGAIISRNQRNKSTLVDLNQAPEKKKGSCCQ